MTREQYQKNGMLTARRLFIASCLLAILATPARADDNGAFVDDQIAKLQAGVKTRQASSKRDAFGAEREAIIALGDRGDSVERDPELRKLYEDKVIPELIKCFDEGLANYFLIPALKKIGPAALPPLLDAIAHDRDPNVRAGAAQTLDAIRPRTRDTLSALIAALHDEDARVRYAAAFTLTDFALTVPEARAPLIQALADFDVRQAVTHFADEYHSDLERDAPEILRGLEAQRDADPARRVAGWLYHAFLALAVLSLLTFVYGMYFRRRDDGSVERSKNELIPTQSLSRKFRKTRVHKIYARTKSVGWSYSESMDLSDLIEGLKVGDPKCIDFALRGPAFVSFALSTFLAIGFGMVFYDQSAGWVFVGFILLFMGVVVQQTMLSYRLRRARIKGGAEKGPGAVKK